MTEIEFVWDSHQRNVFADRKVEKALGSALRKAGGDALRAMRVTSSREIREKKRLKVKKVNDSLPLIHPGAGVGLDGLVWTMRVSGKAIPLAAFPFRQFGRKKGRHGGVAVALNTTGPKTTILGAFVARMPTADPMKRGHLGIFRRRGRGRLPIDEAFGPTIAALFKNAGMISGVQYAAQTVFSRTFERLLPLELAKLK